MLPKFQNEQDISNMAKKEWKYFVQYYCIKWFNLRVNNNTLCGFWAIFYAISFKVIEKSCLGPARVLPRSRAGDN